MVKWCVAAWALIACACVVEPNQLVCSDGTVCPVTFRCLPAGGCRAAELVEPCDGLADGDACVLRDAPGVCVGGVCTFAICGNGITEAPEVCDDGNQLGGDGCNGTCSSNETCGNGVLELQEECDCGDEMHPGNASCMTEDLMITFNGGAKCSTSCVIVRCGNGVVESGEVCDDGDQESGDGCNYNCTSAEVCGNKILDYFKYELCDDGDLESHDGCSSQCQPESLTWRPWIPNAAPQARRRHALAYDAAHGRIVLFGGQTSSNGYLDDTWLWDGAVWTKQETVVRPSPRFDAAMAYDAKRQRVVLFGGTSSTGGGEGLNDTWEWDGVSWTKQMPPVSPPGRVQHAMAYDAAHGNIVLFGGYAAPNGLADTWTWNGVTWTDKTPASPALSPSARSAHAMAYDAAHGAVVLFGGDGSSGKLDETWLWNGTTWAKQTPVDKPEPRTFHTTAYDATRKRVIMFGGSADGPGTTNDTWEWTGSNWVKRTPGTMPTERLYHALAFDQQRGVTVLFGGENTAGSPTTDTWLWNGTNWTLALVAPSPPTHRDVAATYDAGRARVVMFGGGYTASNQTWEWDGIRWRLATPTASPPARYGSSMAYDPIGRRILMFGGSGGTGSDDETWKYDGTTWTMLTPATSPPGRYDAMMTYNSKRKVLVLFGGFGSSRLNDTWEFDGTTWTDKTPTTSPSPRNAGVMSYDAKNDEVVLFGGYLAGGNYAGDTWVWDGNAWEQRTPTQSPTGRGETGMAYLPGRGTILLFGGYDEVAAQNDLWEWDGESMTWTQRPVTGAPEARADHTFVYDAARQGFVMFGGYTDNSGNVNDTWTFSYESSLAVETCLGPDSDLDGRAGCADDDCFAMCTPLCAPGMTSCDPAWPKCGDGVCTTAESCRLCPQDCSVCSTCGDFFCDTGETTSNCPGDCP